jgi:hypothetical protein
MECASTDETRVILNGCYLDLSDQKCTQIVATDGRHLYSSNSFRAPQSLSIGTQSGFCGAENNAKNRKGGQSS